MRDLVIIGAGGHGRETLDVVEAMNRVCPRWNFVGFLDDGVVFDQRVDGRGSRIIGPLDQLLGMEGDTDWVIAIGKSEVRRNVATRLSDVLQPAAPMVHPQAVLGSGNTIGNGVIISAGCHVTTNVSLGRHTHLNVGCVVQHDSTVGDYVTLSPGVFVNGDVNIGNDVFLGAGAIVTRGVSVGDGAVIGAGSVVLHDVEPNMKVMGVPARAVGLANSGDAVVSEASVSSVI